MEANIIEISNMKIKYGDFEVVKGVDINIKKGEFVSIIGPNGSGKSTILKGINKNIDLSTGDVFIKGKNLNSISYKEKAKIIGFVPQEFNVAYDFSVYDIVSMGRNPYTKRFGKAYNNDSLVVEDALKKTNTFKFKDKNFNNLSGGEKQRVITARALAQEPEILILDEATSNLDIHHQLDILELLHWLNREEGMTVVSVMHDLNMASRFSDKLILINKGLVVKEGSPYEVLKEDILNKVYNMEMIIRDNKILSSKEIVPLRVRKAHVDKNIKVHIICGGGTGEYIIQKLYSERYIISTGILNEGDSDLELCRNLGIDYVGEHPFSTFSVGNIAKCKEYINDSNVIIITDVAIGWGNFKNIKMIENIKNKHIIILHSIDRDFVDGEYENIINNLKRYENVSYVMNLKELFERIDK